MFYLGVMKNNVFCLLNDVFNLFKPNFVYKYDVLNYITLFRVTMNIWSNCEEAILSTFLQLTVSISTCNGSTAVKPCLYSSFAWIYIDQGSLKLYLVETSKICSQIPHDNYRMQRHKKHIARFLFNIGQQEKK